MSHGHTMHHEPVEPTRRAWLSLLALSFALFMVMLDNTVVNVALPAMRSDLGIGVSELEWVVNSYMLTFAVLMLTGGKLADLYGRRRIFLAGLAIFTLSSLACGLADSASALIAARAAQGVGGAVMMPATLSIIIVAFPPHRRGAAIGTWAGVSAMALAFGPLIGGLITEHVGWSWNFLVNVPVGIVGFCAAAMLIDESRDERPGQRLDPAGLVTSGVALGSLTYALIEANEYGWGSARIVSLLAVATLSLVAFVALERRASAPMLDLGLFRNRVFAGTSVVGLLIALSMFGVFFFMSLFLQQVLGYSPVKAGVSFLPMTMTTIVVAPIAGRASDRIGSRIPMVVGLLMLATALAIFSRMGVDAGYADFIPGMVLGGLGIAMTMSPMATAAMQSVSPDQSGVASAVLNTARQVGGVLGIAVMGAIVQHSMVDAAAAARRGAGAHGGDAATAAFPVDGFIDGFTTAMQVGTVTASLGAVAAFLTVRGTGAGNARRAAAAAAAARASGDGHGGGGAEGGMSAAVGAVEPKH